jgi:hypothetical protein
MIATPRWVIGQNSGPTPQRKAARGIPGPIRSMEFAQDKVRSWLLGSYPSRDKPDAHPHSGKDGKYNQGPKSAPHVTAVVVMLHGPEKPPKPGTGKIRPKCDGYCAARSLTSPRVRGRD